VTDESDSQDQKHLDSSISTVVGIRIDSSDEGENASDSVRVNCEFGSDVIDENDLQFDKHAERRISTFRGIKIDLSDERENASDSICVKRESGSNAIERICH
jgi:hypothetical protein